MQFTQMQNVSIHVHCCPNIQGPTSQMNITKQFNCLTHNSVYVIRCTKLYIGETGRTIDTRFKEHLSDIKH